MNKSDPPSDEKWIHSFAVTDVCLHPKKFTVYKITSVVFPINIPEALTCLTVWKRFNDIKALIKYVKKRHRSERLLGTVPTISNHTFFKRFEADVITERKLFIIRLLDFVAQHPTLYKSQVFQEFFAKGQTVPYDENLQFATDDISNEDPNVTPSTSFVIDPNEVPTPSTSSSMNESFSSSSISSPLSTTSNENCSDGGYTASDEEKSKVFTFPNNNNKSKLINSNDNLLAEHLSKDMRENILQRSYESPCQPNQRKDLSQFKVLRVMNGVMQVQDTNSKHVYIMKSISKALYESEEFYLPTNFPFMVSLVAYYIADTNIYLLLEQAPGGRLYDYLRSYGEQSSQTEKTVEKFLSTNFDVILTSKSLHRQSSTIEIPDSAIVQPKTEESQTVADDKNLNCSFYELLQSYYEDIPISNSAKSATDTVDGTPRMFEEAPHFDLVANDLDVNNILNCSQKLLKSVSSTLQRVQLNETTLLSNEIVTKYNDSVESLDTSVEQDSGTDDPYASASKLSRIDEFYECIETTNGYSDTCNIADVSQLPRAILKRWFREIIFAIKHLHANDIILFDLKPDNLLLGKNGEILLTYFYRREFNPYCDVDSGHQTCYPIVNIAPERPLSFQSDCWSIGVIFFELITGYSFQSCHPDGNLTYFEIQYPENFEPDANTKDLLERLLQTDPEQRIKLDEIEEHPFFISI